MRTLITLLLSSLFFSPSFGQGCSDAGFCTMGAMKPDQNYSKRIVVQLRSLEVNFYRGTSLLTPRIYAATVDFNLALNDRNSLQIKVPYQWASGSLGENGGLSDISLSLTRSLKTTSSWNVNGTVGAKIPSGDANKKITNEFTNQLPATLHMYYQNSLGSYDAIAGISAISNKWLFATGIQIALTRNNNQFDHEGFANYHTEEYLVKYNVGKELKRGTDIMFRAERNWRFTNFNFSLGLLPIIRITQDEGIPQGETARVKLPNTTGMALSALASFGYQFDVNSSIKIIQGIKLTDRDFNPDGLTRDEVLSVSYIYKF